METRRITVLSAGLGVPSSSRLLADQLAAAAAQQLTAFRAGTSYGRDENANLIMVGVSKYLTDEEIQSLASYVQGLHTAAGEVAATR